MSSKANSRARSGSTARGGGSDSGTSSQESSSPDGGASTAVRNAGRLPHVLREYALLADGERGALVGPRGDICWLCAPQWHSPSVFSTLIGGRGHYSVTPEDVYVWGGSYENSSMIWRSRWITQHGEIECREALSYPSHRNRLVLLRQLRAMSGPARVWVELEPRADYDQTPMRDISHHGDVWAATLGRLSIRWQAGPKVRRRGDALVAEIALEAGEGFDLVLEIADGSLPDKPADAATTWQATASRWTAAVGDAGIRPDTADTRRSQAVLTGLTSSGGGMVAAATTSLPERADAGRNYDYRFVWIRDQCYTGHAAAASGSDYLLDAAVRFVTERLLDDGDRLAPAYTVNGEDVPDERHLDLPGYPGGSDIVGNHVNSQFQLDAFGEALLLLATAADHDRLDDTGRAAMALAAEAIEKRWTEPDAGVWELDPKPWTHSRLICAAGLRAAAPLAGGSRMASWTSLADTIVAHTSATSLHPDGRWQRAPDDARTDGALLLAGLRGAVPMEDPRTVATLEGYLQELTRDGYAYRFRHDDRPLHEAEGSFVLCGFWTALSLNAVGRRVEARAFHERNAASCGPPVLFSEEFDVIQHQMRGNLPQAFVHALMLESAARLDADWPAER